MTIDPFKPTFLIQIEGETLAEDITQEITSFTFEDNEKGLDVLTLTVTNRNHQFVDHPLFQEGNEIVARWGYVDNLSPRKKAVIKDVDYEFPENGDPRIRLKAFDKGFKLSGKENQKVWQKPAPGILYSEIAEHIARANGLSPVIEPTLTPHLRVVQSNQSDAHFLQELAKKARAQDGDGAAGYVFFIQDDTLHFHPRRLEQAPAMVLEYFTSRQGLLRSVRVDARSQGAKGAGTETTTIGLDPRKKEPVVYKANNDTTPERTSLGKRTYLVDANTGEGGFKEQETGHVVPTFESAEALHEKPTHEPSQDAAESQFKETELRQVEATAQTIGIPQLTAKANVELRGLGQKLSGIYYVTSIRHQIGESGYTCDLRLRRNALGAGAGDKSEKSKGIPNEQAGPATPQEKPPAMVTVDADTGDIIEDPREG
ncbi:Phage late control D family protein [Sulfidibacter corallicola]|uniref:Phage late control D family protein n=1 Tax=Sulfidibacter corallicola TaxID=2818388 RepID=A0A8A4TZ28_SULCO|nr:hypothetical protein [Sulfidibacter corallicola]QTD54202.1 phage late control D family protein [Sulfidibacter corallicola]